MMNNLIRAQLRQQAALWLKDTCTIQREVHVQDAFGGTSTTWVTVATAAACRVIKAGERRAPADEITAGQDTIDEQYRLSLLHDVSIDVDYRVITGGITYQVVSIESALTDEVFTQAIIQRKR